MKTIISAMLVSLVAAATSQAIALRGCTTNQRTQLRKAVLASDQLVFNAQSYLAQLTAKKTGFYESYFGGWGPSQSQTVMLHFDAIGGEATLPLRDYDCGACRAENPDKYHSMDAYVDPKSEAINLCGEFWKKGTTGRDSQAGILLRENVKAQVDREMSVLPAAERQRLEGGEIGKTINPNNYRNFAEQFEKPRKLNRWL